MRTADFDYDLPEALIAQYPAEPRSASRLLALNGQTGEIRDLQFVELANVVAPADLLVFNNTRVIPARLFGRKESGGLIEVLIERILDAHRVLAQVRASKPLHAGGRVLLEEDATARVIARRGSFYELRLEHPEPVTGILERIGHVPLPPYIMRPDAAVDRKRYQAIYADVPGAVAAPTAGLHFDNAMFARLRSAGVEIAFVTLHIGAGTFQPVRAQDVRDHRMHSEYVEIDERVTTRIGAARARGGRIIAVGTTVVRALETAARRGPIDRFAGESDLFIYPGYRFQVVDAMLTNFHLPRSSLLMLVCAFAGTAHVLRAYRHAVEQCYRFFSYGDAMFVTPQETSNK
ncbi:MAG: tRNA preQ1(34) S-adenosylmethionine ribosyltransferase-isomerase QueA [Acidiferrobacterales bacterium]